MNRIQFVDSVILSGWNFLWVVHKHRWIVLKSLRTINSCLCCKQRDLVVEMNELLNVSLLEQASPGYRYHEYEFDQRKSSAESRVRCFNHRSYALFWTLIQRQEMTVYKIWMAFRVFTDSDVILGFHFNDFLVFLSRQWLCCQAQFYPRNGFCY